MVKKNGGFCVCAPISSRSLVKIFIRFLRMKTNALTIMSVLLVSVTLVSAQGTAFTYQGRLNDGASAASGLYDINFTLFDAVTNGNVIAGPVTNIATSVNDGLFTVTLDFGAGAFDRNARFLELGVRTNGSSQFVILVPRQPITAAPYAITAGDVTSSNIARLNVPNTAVQATGHPIVSGGSITGGVVDNGGSGYTTAPAVTVNANGPGSGAKLTAMVSGGSVVGFNLVGAGSGYTSSATLTIGLPPPNNSQVFVTSNYFPNANFFSNPTNVFVGNGAGLNGLWKLGGNGGTTPGSNFVGTVDNQPLEFKVNNQRALRVEPNTKGAPNWIGGSPVNFVAPTTVGAVIAGGGATNYDFVPQTNWVAADFGTIGGGMGNSIEADAIHSTIGGGDHNAIGLAALESSIGGGGGNLIYENAVGSYIGGGVANQIWSDSSSSSIGGGYNNTIQSGSGNSSIGGGVHNTIQFDANGGTIGGGNNNMIQFGAYGSTIGGGSNNTIEINTYGATIGAGSNNLVQFGAHGATIGGGSNNTIQTNAYGAAIGGGFSNTVSGPRAAVPGGNNNVASGAYSFAAGHNAQALHDGCFVWSDSVSTNVTSTATNQFIVGASGGVWLQGTNTSLRVDGQSSFGGWSIFNGYLTAYSGASLYGTIYHNGYSYLNNGAAIYNGASINGYSYINNGVQISGGENVYGYSYFNNGAAIYGANLYSGSYVNNGLQINSAFSSGWQLYLTANAAGKPGGGSWGDNSDARLKKNIQPMTGALDKLTKLRGVTFEWINPADHGDLTNVQSGFIAQEVERVFPEWVTKMGASEHDKALTEDGKVRTLSLPLGYDALVVESIKELRAENLELKTRIEKLERLISALNHKSD